MERSIVTERIKRFADKWKWESLSLNPKITFQNILDYPDKPWNWLILSGNKSILTVRPTDSDYIKCIAAKKYGSIGSEQLRILNMLYVNRGFLMNLRI